ncbi:VOC family protein [Fulvivirgaceae bacterium BMA10]|uniref:VOC family protein n=1 Tax=Splendidivirga corallicola TaxID=3051826 RepID=A0ABT8KQ58_9BACT|nr:VOC family protein [Fulvivirgaceae bacterium BMA10]
MANAVNWFELPVNNMERAIEFYNNILGINLSKASNGPMEMAMFAADHENYGACGALVKADGYNPADSGSIVYLNGGEDLSDPLNRVESAGGKVVMPKTSIGENGFIAHFIDSEGNRVALHSMK